ncbi:copper resistance CopC family protein [Cohnella cholangitidis]|uniref:copper resistance CopC family protein n=1 Tax=Cohnella cholangitidis TaxID=2598458 RepID=UPI0015FCE0FB|nr:copper resistance protein CopC [Cohnella cholangitidis]
MKLKIKAIFAVILLGLIVIPNIVLAHSALVSAVPSYSEAATTEVSELKLEFNTPIEPLSSIKVKDEAGSLQPLKETNTDGKFLTGVLEKPLTDGKYTVDWKIIGEDGHAIKGSYSFVVRIPEPVPTETAPSPSPSASEAVGQGSSEPTGSDASAGTPVPTTVESPTEVDEDSTSSPLNTSNLISNIVLVLAAVLLVIAVVYVVFFKKKK